VVYVIGKTAPTGWAFFHLLTNGCGGGDNMLFDSNGYLIEQATLKGQATTL
jgi:hypothetical protein